jgi:hypothetical protein
MHKPVSVAWRERPFDGAFSHFLIPRDGHGPMPTIGEIVALFPNKPRGFEVDGEVRLNGDLVPRRAWKHVRPGGRGLAQACITLHVPLRGPSGGGGGSGKQTAALVATIAVLLAAAAVSGGALGPAGLGLLGTAFAGATTGAAVLGASIGIGGALLISALFKPPSLSVANTQQKAPAAAGDLTAALQGNALSPGAAMPRVVGTLRVYPQVLSPPLVELVGENLYAEAVYGLAGPHVLANIQSDGVDITDVSFRNEITLETQEGLLNTRQTLVSRQGHTESIGLEMSQAQLLQVNSQGVRYDTTLKIEDAVPQWHQLVTRDSPDEFWISLGFPSGLSKPANAADRDIAFRVRFRLQGASTWINAPELHVSRDASLLSPFAKEIRLKWGTFPTVPADPPDSTGATNGWIYAFKHVPTQSGLTPAGIGGWDADASFSLGAGNDLLSSVTAAANTSNVTNIELFADRAIIYLDPATFPQGVYEVQVIRSWSYLRSGLTASTYVYAGNTYDLFGYSTSSGFNIIGENVVGVYDKVTVDRVASVWLQNPIQSSDFATISVRVTKRALGQVSVLASGYVADWDGSGWNTITTTSNPAPHFRDVLGGVLGGSPLPATLIDDSGLLAWRTACTSLGYECNAVLEGKTYVDALNLIAACGYATLRASETWGIVRDRDRSADAPVQIFTPRNMRNFVWTKAFTRQPTGFRVSYINAALGYIKDELIVFADDVNQDATYLESITYDGLTTAAEVTARAQHDLLQGQKRLTFYSGECDLDALVCQRGDLVGVQHDTLSAKAGFARIKSVQTASGNVTGLTFEGTTPVDTESGIFVTPHLFTSPHIFSLGSRTGVAIRLLGGAGILVKEIVGASNDELPTVTFAMPFADPGHAQLDADCLCAIGPLGSEMRRLLVYDIDPKPADFTATLTFVDEAPELWT